MHLPMAVSDFLYGRNAHTASDKGARASARETTSCVCRMVWGLRAYIYKSTLGNIRGTPIQPQTEERAPLRARRHPAYAGWSGACELTFINHPWGNTRNAHTAADRGARASISVSHSISYRSAPESMARWSVSPLLPGKTMPHGCFHPVYCAPEAPDPPPADT